MGEIIWVVVSGTALVSERGPGRVFGDLEGAGDGLLSPLFGPSWGARSALRCASERLGHSVLISVLYLAVGKDHRSAAQVMCALVSLRPDA